MRKITQAISAVCLLFALNSSAVAPASSPSPLNPSVLTLPGLLNRHQFIGFRSHKLKIASQGVRQWRWGLISMTRYFFSSPGFWRGKKKLLARKRRLSEKSCVLGKKMNNGWDEFSIPKEVARQLIDMHVRRGDAIFFVTGRSPTKTETVSKNAGG